VWERARLRDVYATIERLTNEPSTSLRAKGLRERAPEDRLREAIKSPKQELIASSQALLAMTEAAMSTQLQ
jgi:hypothetical protein